MAEEVQHKVLEYPIGQTLFCGQTSQSQHVCPHQLLVYSQKLPRDRAPSPLKS